MLEIREPEQDQQAPRGRMGPAPVWADIPVPRFARTERLLNVWAVLTAVATFVLLAIGSVVTTLKVGMADPVWPTYPWHLLLIDWREPKAGFLIEHAHRAMGYVVGCLTIVLALALWRYQTRRWLRWLGVAALGAVIVMGLLGGFRVRLHERFGVDLATFHGCFAQLVFALLCSIGLFTSRGWAQPGVARGTELKNRQLARVAWAAAALVYVQIVFGAMIRHTLSSLGQRAHVLIAFAVVASVVWLARTVYAERVGRRGLVPLVTLLVILVVLQLVLGIETWISRFGSGVLPDLQQVTLRPFLLRTGHFLIGSLIFATTVAAALMATRRAPAITRTAIPDVSLEGAR